VSSTGAARPLRNRVTPFGEIVAVPGRGLLMGNRGVIHDAEQRIVRDSQVKRWIACRLEFRGRHRWVMPPNRWTALFFLDEAAALAAGHRPCGECRHADYARFKAAWQLAHGSGPWSADAMDLVLHPERRTGPWRKRTSQVNLDDLPDGAYVAIDDAAFLVQGDALLGWSPDRYVSRQARPHRVQVTLLTPPSLVSVLRAGYVPMIHPSA
jgi:hypothetical protein